MESNVVTQIVAGGVATIFVRDMNRSVRFYTETLGFALKYRVGDHWAAIDAGNGFTLGLHPAAAGESCVGVRGGIQIGFDVTRPMEEAMAELEARGVAFPNGIHDDGAVRLAFFSDPDGNEHYLCEHTAS